MERGQFLTIPRSQLFEPVKGCRSQCSIFFETSGIYPYRKDTSGNEVRWSMKITPPPATFV
jgi:hypothetical protein